MFEDDNLEDDFDGPEPEEQEPEETPEPAKDEKADEVAEIRAQMAKLAERNDALFAELNEARKPKPEPKPKAKPEPEPDEDEDPEKTVDDFAKKGVKALKARGFVTAKEAEERAEQAAERAVARALKADREQMSGFNAVAADYPELSDVKSPLFLRTKEILDAELKADPSLASSPSALRMAARVAKAELGTQGRRERVNAQLPPKSARNSSNEPGQLGSSQRKVAAMFGLSEDAYRKGMKG